MRALLVTLALALVACGAQEAPPPVAPIVAATAAVPTSKTLADLEREFLASCTPKVPDAPAFCACGWEQMTKTFSEEEMRGNVEDSAKVRELRERIHASCKRSLPEANIRLAFGKACAGDQPGRASYCDCMWSELRGHFSAADLADEGVLTSDRFADTRHSVARTCAGRLPEDLARERFVELCAKEPTLRPFCGCAWKILRVDASGAEIDGGFINAAVTQPKIERSCAQQRPKP